MYHFNNFSGKLDASLHAYQHSDSCNCSIKPCQLSCYLLSNTDVNCIPMFGVVTDDLCITSHASLELFYIYVTCILIPKGINRCSYKFESFASNVVINIIN